MNHISILGYGEYAHVGGVGERMFKVVDMQIRISYESVHALADHA